MLSRRGEGPADEGVAVQDAQRGARGDADSESRVLALDGVRGIALIAVLLYHFFAFGVTDAGGGGPAFDQVFRKIISTGWIGLDVFFVLSGYLITGILLDTKRAQAGRYFRNFYARRSLRIFPVYYVYLVLLFLLIPLLVPAARGAIDALAQDRVWFAVYLGNILPAVHGATRPDFFVTGHVWSLAVEEQFYLVWPVVVLVLSRRRLMVFCLFMIAGALVTRTWLTVAGAEEAAALTLTPARMDSLAVGALLALALRDPKDERLLRHWLPPLAAGAAVAVAVLAVREGRLAAFDATSQTAGYTLIAIMAAAVLLLSMSVPRSSAAGRFLHAPVLLSASKYSYAMYLVHLPVVWVLEKRAGVAASFPTLFGSQVPGELAFTGVAAVVTFAFAWVSWRFVEGPALRLKALFPYSGRTKAEAGSSAHRAVPPAREDSPA